MSDKSEERPYSARREEEELDALQKVREGKGTPINIIRRPLKLPDMERVKK